MLSAQSFVLKYLVDVVLSYLFKAMDQKWQHCSPFVAPLQNFLAFSHLIYSARDTLFDDPVVERKDWISCVGPPSA